MAATPSQTVGPFFSIGLPYPDGAMLATDATRGERISVRGRVLAGGGAAVPDALIEVWQANAAGRYAHAADARAEVPLDPAFLGFGRTPTDAEGRFAFATIRPGRVPGPSGSGQAPHLTVLVFARGLLRSLWTRRRICALRSQH